MLETGCPPDVAGGSQRAQSVQLPDAAAAAAVVCITKYITLFPALKSFFKNSIDIIRRYYKNVYQITTRVPV